MTCGELSEGLELHFLESGVRVRPLEGRLKEEGPNLQAAQFEVTHEAALVIKSNTLPAEPVMVRIDGVDAHRMVMPETGITIRHDLEEDTVGEIQLQDALTVLQRSILSEAVTDLEIGDIVESFLEQRDDPHSVITGWRWTDEQVTSDMIIRIQEEVALPDGDIEVIEVLDEHVKTLASQQVVSTIDTDGDTVFDAFMNFTQDLGVEAWVLPNGTLMIGHDATWGEVITSIDSDSLDELANYTVTQNQSEVSHVMVRGTFPADFDQLSWVPGNGPDIGYAEAKIPGEDGRRMFHNAGPIESLDELEHIAARILARSSMETTNGTIEFDGLQSSQIEKLAKARHGDHVVVDGQLIRACEDSPNQLVGGEYVLNSIQHRLNPREGWRVITRVGRIPTDIETSSFFYDATAGLTFEDVGSLGQENTTAPRSSPYQ